MTDKTFLFTDWLGQDIYAGDFVSYAITSGRAIALNLGRTVRLTEKGELMVERFEGAGSRWNVTGGGYIRYIDSRSGKGIDPYGSNGKHIKKDAHWVDKDGLVYDDFNVLWKALGGNYREVASYVKTEFHDYVTEVETPPKPVRLQVLKNVTRLDQVKAVEYLLSLEKA